MQLIAVFFEIQLNPHAQTLKALNLILTLIFAHLCHLKPSTTETVANRPHGEGSLVMLEARQTLM